MPKKHASKQVLRGHKKKGSTFVPPMMQIDNIKEFSYLNDALPNLVWMGLVFDRFGYRSGVELIEQFVSTCYRQGDDNKVNYNYISSFSSLDIDLKSAIYKDLKSKRVLASLQDAVSPLSCLFQHFPMLFLKPDFKVDESDLVPRLKTVMNECIDKYSKMATAIQVTALYTLGINKKLFFTQNVTPPDLNSIFIDPDSEAAGHAASFARSNILVDIGMREDEMPKTWVRDFWLQIYKLEPCELMVPE